MTMMEHTPHTPAAQPGTAEFFLEVAEQIGRRVARAAEWQGEACTWTIMSPDRDRPEARVAKPATASGTLYEGTSGIGLFLAELAAALGGDEELKRAAVGAIRFALDEGAELPSGSVGLHGGRVGIAYAAARTGVLLGEPGLVREAEELVRGIEGSEDQDRGLDVIAGAGGAIPPLLAMAQWLEDRELPVRVARRMGEHLIATADHETHGWGWGTMRGSAIRHLCGYAHGSAGCGHGLMELWHATGDSRFLYGAEQAFLYERGFFSPEAQNWPDLRHNELGEFLYQGRTSELRDKVLAGDAPPEQPLRYMSAWCHGGPGIGLTRLRAWQLTRDPLYLDEARAALSATDTSLRDPRMNYSLCHGRGGNAETPLIAARLLGEEEHMETARRVAMEGWEEFERAGAPWSCGTMGAVADPGLLLGEAGIGYFFLRLARPETPSILLVEAPAAAAQDDGGAGYRELGERTVAEFFGRTLQLFKELGVDGVVTPRDPGASPEASDVELAHDALAARVAAETDPALREQLEDAFRLDRERYELSRSVRDFTKEFLDALVRGPDEEVRWPEARIELSPRARVVHGAYDWDAWLEHGGAEEGAPEAQDTFHLLQATGARVTARRLSPFAALVLKSVEQPATLEEVVAEIEEAVSSPGSGPGRDWLEDRVVEQLRQAYRAGFLSSETGMAAAAA